MSLLTLILTGFGLAMDAVAVSIGSGLKPVPPRHLQALKMALWFGAFQAAMPVAGYALGLAFKDWVESFDHWIAFLLLVAIGGKMLHEAFSSGGKDGRRMDPFAFKTLTLLAVATSIDALAVGVSFSLLEIGLLPAVTVIGLTTFALCYPAVVLGRRLGGLFARRAEVVGGLVLIGIGVKILVEHTLLG